jgi:hypothetical protein
MLYFCILIIMENLSFSRKDTLMQLSRQHNIRGRSTMNKAQLIAELTPLLPRRVAAPTSSSRHTLQIVDSLPADIHTGGSGTFNMAEMEAALQIPVEQIKLANDIDNNIFLADQGIRGGLQQISAKLRITPMKPAQFIQIKKQIKQIIGKYGSTSESEPESSSSSSRKKRQLVTKRKRSS